MVSFYKPPISNTYYGRGLVDALNELGPITSSQVAATRSAGSAARPKYKFTLLGDNKTSAQNIRQEELYKLANPAQAAAQSAYRSRAMRDPEVQSNLAALNASLAATHGADWRSKGGLHNAYNPNRPGATAVQYRTPATPEVQQNYSDSLAKALGVDDEIHPVHQFGYNPYQPSRVSLFGGPKPGLPKTDAMKSAEASYAAGFARSPEALAYNDKVNSLLEAGLNIGYGTYRKDGKLYNNGREITGYGYANEDATTPTFLSGSQSMGGTVIDNSTGSQSMGGTVIDNSTGSPVQPPQNPSNAFLDGLNAQLANYDNYTVNSNLGRAEQSLRDMLVNAQNNNADASTIGRIQMALDDIGRLGQDRTRQQGIIDQARRDAQSNLTNFGTSYTDVDYRNAQALDSLSRQLDQITNPNLDVELNYDFSDLAGDVDPYREVVQNMRDRRMRELNALGEDIAGIGNSLEGFYSPLASTDGGAVALPMDPLTIVQNPDGTISETGGQRTLRDIQSASEVYDIRDRLNEALNSLDVYGVGSRSNELRGQIFNQDEIYGQLADQLRGRQGQIETDAQAQLDALAQARLTRPDDIRSFEEALRDLSGQRDLFDAATAADELERLTDQVQRARSDLERDEAARIARQQLERMRALQTQGAAGFNNNYMTADDYSAYLRALEMGRDDQYFEGMGTSFSRALGLA